MTDQIKLALNGLQFSNRPQKQAKKNKGTAYKDTAYTERLMDNLYMIDLETRTDWLFIEVINVCAHIGKPVSELGYA